MERKLLANASFSEVYDFLKGRQDSEMFQCFKSLFGISLLFLPGLVCRDTASLINPEMLADLATGAGLAGAGVCALVGDAVKSVFNLLKKKNYKDYTTRYEQMQIAQVMLVYAAYFDAISRCLPDENNEIALSEKVRRRISRKGLQTYKAELEESAENGRLSKKLSEKVALPDPTWEFSHYKKQLKYFYTELNTEFIRFFSHTQFFEDLEKGADEAERALNREQKECFLQILNGLPENAVKIYEQQYFQLQEAFPDFAVWAEHNEHSRMEAGIDVEFKAVSRELKRLASMLSYPEDKAAEVLFRYQTKYTEYIKGPVIEYNVSGPVQDIVFPEKGNIFIPQAFQSVSFHQGMRVESEAAWKNAYAGEDIGRYISSILRHPRCGALPLLILGLPGAGKESLSHYHYHKFDKRYNELIKQAREENPLPVVTEKKRGRKKKGKILALAERLDNYKASVCLFIHDFMVPFDNNQAERDIRMIKVKTKVSGCFRSEDGARDYLKIMSYVGTAHKQGHNAYDAIRKAFSGCPDFIFE